MMTIMRMIDELDRQMTAGRGKTNPPTWQMFNMYRDETSGLALTEPEEEPLTSTNSRKGQLAFEEESQASILGHGANPVFITEEDEPLPGSPPFCDPYQKAFAGCLVTSFV